MCFATQSERVKTFLDLKNKSVLPTEMKTKYPSESELILMMTDNNPVKRPSTNYILKESKLYKEMKNKYK